MHLVRRNFEDRHAGIMPFDDPFEVAIRQNDHLMREDSWSSFRLRLLLLGQLWSISRWNEMCEWKLCDLMREVFSIEADLSLRQAIVPLYILQTKYKGSTVCLQKICC